MGMGMGIGMGIGITNRSCNGGSCLNRLCRGGGGPYMNPRYEGGQCMNRSCLDDGCAELMVGKIKQVKIITTK